MNITLWTKALIIAQPKLDMRIAKLQKKMNSYVKGCYGAARDAEKQLNGLYDIIVNIKKIEYLDKVLKEALNKLSRRKEMYVLTKRYAEGYSFAEIAGLLNLNIRTVFRQCDKAIALVAEEMLDMGIDEIACEELWGDDHYIRQVSEHVNKLYIAYNDALRLQA